MSPSGIPRIPEPREWVLTKRCARCGETKPWAEFAPKEYNEDGSVRRPYSYCHRCDLERRSSPEFREYQAAWARKKRAEIRRDREGFGPRLDNGPFLAWLEDQIREHGTLQAVADLCGVPERSLRRVTSGEHKNVTLGLVDRCLTARGDVLDELYPYEDEEAA